MGTSSSGSGPRPITPLIPNWILPDAMPVPDAPPSDDAEDSNEGDGAEDAGESNDTNDDSSTESSNRFLEARRNFTSFSKNRTAGANALRSSLRSYVTKASGGSSTMARRMAPSASSVARFYSAVNTIKEQGVAVALRSFNLDSYSNRPVLDVLAALTDVIFDNSGPYNNIHDESITKLAYANTISRIVESENIDLNSLTNENVEVMLAVFIEETIATRVICDIGTSLFKNIQDCQEIIEVEETTYQIVSGLVRNQIMPEIIATQRGQSQSIERNIENIYRIAFDCIAGTIQQ